jgi:antitoxin component YwqK of YwqJK toxin-antitoxin module
MNYLNGVLHGLKTDYSKNSAKIKEEYYILGSLDGWVKTYYENGRLQSEEYYKQGIRQNSKSYDLNGNITSISGY